MFLFPDFEALIFQNAPDSKDSNSDRLAKKAPDGYQKNMAGICCNYFPAKGFLFLFLPQQNNSQLQNLYKYQINAWIDEINHS